MGSRTLGAMEWNGVELGEAEDVKLGSEDVVDGV